MREHKKWVGEIFDKAAIEYGRNSSAFFNDFGRSLVQHAGVLPGQRVLDIATGRGAILFPVADAVGPWGKVIGIDISQQMVEETSKEILEKNLHWAELECMDAEHLQLPDSSFDFVFCGFALFFFPSILTALSEFKRVLKPGGKLVVSIWGEDSELDKLVNREMAKIGTTNTLMATPLWSEKELFSFLKESSFNKIQIFEETKHFLHKTAEQWWDSLWSHAIRARLEQFSQDQIINLREKMLREVGVLDKGKGIMEDLQAFYAIAECLKSGT